jgi:Dolichyl-phosphate-mannose-protein mannosyltransferase
LPLASQINRLITNASELARDLLISRADAGVGRRRLVVICLIIFLLAVGVRLLQWQDNRPILPRLFAGMVEHHKENARLLLNGDVAGFVKGPAPPGDANILMYPPGYPMVMAAVFRIFGESDSSMRVFQIICDAAAAVLLFFLVLELLPWKVAAIAGLLAALSPQLAYYSLILIPDSLVTLPLLLALYFLVRALKHDSLRAVAAAGFFIGLSCWLRSNALLLAPLLALVLLLMLERSRRWRHAAMLVAAAFIVIAPITIRNVLVFHHFIPLSLGTGQMLNVGITDYDREKRFGLPGTDLETVNREAVTYGRPDYASSLFGGNGVQREQDRTARGLAVVRSHPVWFAGVVLRRSVSMLKFERVHIIEIEPGVSHSLKLADEMKPEWLLEPGGLVSQATRAPLDSWTVSANALRFTSRGLAQTLVVSERLPVKSDSDYLIRVPLKVEQGNVILSVIDADQKTVYAATPVFHALEALPGLGQQTHIVEIPFVTRKAGSMQLVLENEGTKAAATVLEIGSVEGFHLGQASFVWTKYPRAIIHFAQKLFITAWIIPFALCGGILLYAAGAGRWLVLLLAIPFYYLSAQSFLHTEYRYVMSIQPSFFVLTAVALYVIANIVSSNLSRFVVARATPTQDRKS